jgi:predicted metal-binding membrane protein
MTGMQMNGPAMPMTMTASAAMMAAMMLPGAVPAIARRARQQDGVLAAPLFAGSYLGVWALVGLATWLLYRPPGAVTAGALIIAAGLYELTPIKHECRRRCREQLRSGVRFSFYCVGSSAGLMLVLVALDVMSVPLMVAVATVALTQKLLPANPAVDLPLALAIVALGVVTAV